MTSKTGRKTSTFMERALVVILATGGQAVPAGGGYWSGLDGKHLAVEPVTPGGIGVVSTHTIQALEDRGLLRRTFQKPDSWKDPRILAFPVIVTDNETQVECRDGYKRLPIVASFTRVEQAEEWIGAHKDQVKVARGGFGIDAPEAMVQRG